MKSKKIVELCLAHGLGGLEMFVASCHEEFSKRTECKVAVCADSKLDRYLGDIEKFYLKRNRLFPIIPALKLAKYIDENGIDIVHFHWTKDMITAVLAKLLSKRKPKLIQSRHMGMTRFKDDLYHKWLYKNIDIIHAVTKQVQSQLEKYIPQDVRPKIEMVYLGTKIPNVDQHKVQELRKKYNLDDAFIVGIVGRIEKPKGQYKIIEAVAKLKDKNIKALIVGSPMQEEYLQELKKKVEHLAIKDKVVFTGFTKQINEHMQLFDVKVLATDNEAFGLVVIEAMANKKPVIATANGGPLEIIDDGVDGVLFDGTSEDLAKKIALVYYDTQLQESLCEKAFTKVSQKFQKNIQLKKLYDVFQKI